MASNHNTQALALASLEQARSAEDMATQMNQVLEMWMFSKLILHGKDDYASSMFEKVPEDWLGGW